MTPADGNIYVVAKDSISQYQCYCGAQKVEKSVNSLNNFPSS